MFNFLQDKAESYINKYAQSSLNVITVKGGECKYNYKCHLNAVHHAIENKEDRIAMVLYGRRLEWNIHFLNVDSKGEYTDNTIGHWADNTDYRLVRYIDSEEFMDISDVFTSYREYLATKVPWWVRMFADNRY